MDRLTPERRSWLMSRVRGKDTTPELKLRRFLHAKGLRYRLHLRSLPGKPDIVFVSSRVAVFVHGCFWHGHDCRYGRLPKTKLDYWAPKVALNRARDAVNVEKLHKLGWDVLTVWQCEIKDAAAQEKVLRSVLDKMKKAIDTRRVSR